MMAKAAVSLLTTCSSGNSGCGGGAHVCAPKVRKRGGRALRARCSCAAGAAVRPTGK
ncbi:MAG: hypothetical protein IJO10_08150 [Clostridia bacterium]|nr:hypothetical protein [Clostridia bacterium]